MSKSDIALLQNRIKHLKSLKVRLLQIPKKDRNMSLKEVDSKISTNKKWIQQILT